MKLHCPECNSELKDYPPQYLGYLPNQEYHYTLYMFCQNMECQEVIWKLGVLLNNLVWEIKIAARDTWKKREDTKTYYYLITAAMYSLRKTSNVLYKLIYNYELIRRKKTRDLWWFFSWQSLRIKYYRRGLRYYTGEYPRRSNN